MNFEQATYVLKDNGYKLTPQRKAILSILCDNKHSLLSTHTIFKSLQKHKSIPNLTTVYRNIDLLVQLNIVHKILSTDGTAHYQLNQSEHTKHQHYLICKQCGNSQSIDYCPLKDIKKVSDSQSFTLTDHKLELYGYCKNCNPKNINK